MNSMHDNLQPRKVGIIGGLSCESSAEYYLRITRKAKEYFGGHYTAEVLMVSVNTGIAVDAAHKNNWDSIADLMLEAAFKLEKMGADCIIIPCNTLHKVAGRVQKNISIPLLNIMDSVGRYIKRHAYSRVALLGTQFTMEDHFYRDYISQTYNIEIEIPDQNNRNKVHNIIFNELCYGVMKKSSKKFIVNLCHELQAQRHCEAVILGCSELPLLIKSSDVLIDLIDTIEIHSDDVVKFATQTTHKSRQPVIPDFANSSSLTRLQGVL